MDMDAFFASVEEAVNPKLKGKPIAVIGAKERTVVVTSSYAARKLGVKTGMSKYEAQRVCPSIVLVVGQPRVYTHISSEISRFLQRITPHVEVYSIDEAFMDISGCEGSSESIAYMIKAYVKTRFNITCSVGVGSNKMIAKMASGHNKPDGYHFVSQDDQQEFIDEFPLGDIWGIGRRLTRKFRDMGIFNTADLRQLGRDRLQEMYGLHGLKLYEMACGRYYEGVNDKPAPVKSIGHSMTLPHSVYTKKTSTALSIATIGDGVCPSEAKRLFG
jgi:DNA polymerase-4